MNEEDKERIREMLGKLKAKPTHHSYYEIKVHKGVVYVLLGIFLAVLLIAVGAALAKAEI